MPPTNHKGRIITPRLPDDHSGDDPLPNGTLVESGKSGDHANHRIWVNGSPLPTTDENMVAAGWTQFRGAWFPPEMV